jgi:hypothetical protein
MAASKREKPRRVWLAVCDHYEPLAGGRVDTGRALERVAQWRKAWPEIALRHRDSTGKPPQYSFFYPQEDYREELIEPLAEMARMSIADVEIHIHHDGEGERDFVDRMRGFIDALSQRHGLLRKVQGQVRFGFIHGNWALDNSRPDGRHCGLNNEIQLLRDLGCYADFTLPSAPSPTQTSIVNTIYWATDDPLQPKSHDTGVPATRGGGVHGDLLMVPGPLGLRMFDDGRVLPRIEMGELAGYDLPTRARVRRWLNIGPAIGEDVFIKLHTHGADDRNREALLNGGLDELFNSMAAECGQRGFELRYATAWDVYQAIMERVSSYSAAADTVAPAAPSGR